MIFNKSVLVQGNTADGTAVWYKEGACDSSETKPSGESAADVADGSVLIETDTGDVYFFNAKTKNWIKQFSLQG